MRHMTQQQLYTTIRTYFTPDYPCMSMISDHIVLTTPYTTHMVEIWHILSR